MLTAYSTGRKRNAGASLKCSRKSNKDPVHLVEILSDVCSAAQETECNMKVCSVCSSKTNQEANPGTNVKSVMQVHVHTMLQGLSHRNISKLAGAW
jgi:hypothetical protein